MGTKTTVHAQILAGNLGDGWEDNNLAAHALAEFTESVWERDLNDASLHVEFAIDVQESTGGAARGVEVTGPNAHAVKSVLTDQQDIWEMFCESPEAEALWAH